ncbi:unnamed protein product [Owenia fusiformis]|uniref:Uncharacterized protein n=1 Tax=Owenia fusiformis TaxID=6347 RepID=A0A8J1T780_OWEFU|nr:unnamed protein product [Owenia fusiformis]
MTSLISRYSKNTVRIAERFAELLFPEKLWYVVNDDDPMFKWTDDGASFTINETYFVENVLDIYPGFLQINLFANVRRLLREYGFMWDMEGEKYVFTHSNFVRGHPELVQNVTRWRTRRRSKTGRRTILHALPREQISPLTSQTVSKLDRSTKERIEMIVPKQTTKTKKFITIIKGRDLNSSIADNNDLSHNSAHLEQSRTTTTKNLIKSAGHANFPRNMSPPVSPTFASSQSNSKNYLCDAMQFTAVKNIAEERDPILEHHVWSALFDDFIQEYDHLQHPQPAEFRNSHPVSMFDNEEYIYEFEEM